MIRWQQQPSPQKNMKPKKRRILNPQGNFLQKWNKIFAVSCIIAVSLDPLFFYIPMIVRDQFCLTLDRKVEIAACVLRSMVDIFYVFHIVLQFRTGFIVPSSHVFRRGKLVKDSRAIAKHYLRSYFVVDVLSILPLPQMVVLMVRHAVKEPVAHVMKEMLKAVIFIQYIPRVWRIYPLYQEVTRTSGIFTKTAWAGASFNLSLFMLASHVVGALWYLFAIERKDSCWREACRNNTSCNVDNLYCIGAVSNALFLNSSCPLKEQNELNATDFDFGIALDALRVGVAEHDHFFRKFFFCFWWGLRNLSSLGQNLNTSTFVGEVLFAIAISVIGLILFSLFIGNMQKYLQSITTRESRVEEMRVKLREAEHWMSYRMLPEDLRARVRRYGQYKWQEHGGVEEDSLIGNLPNDLRRDIKRYLCLNLLKMVPLLNEMDEGLLEALCTQLKPVLYTEGSYILRQGDPVDQMLFMVKGEMATISPDFNEMRLKAGDFCGEELLINGLSPPSRLPISTWTVQAVTDVEAYCLMPDDLKIVVSQFRHLNFKQLQSTFRFHSRQWRTWAACFIQAAWRRFCRKKMERAKEAEFGGDYLCIEIR